MVNYAVSGENNLAPVLSTGIMEDDNFVRKTRQLIKPHQIPEAHFTSPFNGL